MRSSIRLKKTGGSVMLIIPAKLRKRLALKPEQLVRVMAVKGCLVVVPQPRRASLPALQAQGEAAVDIGEEEPEESEPPPAGRETG